MNRSAHSQPATETGNADRAPADGASDIERRLDRLEALIERLVGDDDEDPAGDAAPGTRLPDEFWALNALKKRVPPPGAVVYAGAVDLPVGHLEYQWGRPTDPLLRAEWADRADRIAALGHPLRLSMLRLLLEGDRTVAQLVDELDLGSTGVAYHHLNQLQNAGWATSPRRGVWAVPASRIVPLLAIITAAEES